MTSFPVITIQYKLWCVSGNLSPFLLQWLHYMPPIEFSFDGGSIRMFPQFLIDHRVLVSDPHPVYCCFAMISIMFAYFILKPSATNSLIALSAPTDSILMDLPSEFILNSVFSRNSNRFLLLSYSNSKQQAPLLDQHPLR